MYDIENMVVVGRLFLIIAVIATTAFPVMYSFSPWYRSRLGRAVMVKAVAFCLTIWLKVVTTFFLNEDTRPVILWVNAFALILIGMATFTMTYELFLLQRKQLREKKEDYEQLDGATQ